MSALSNFPSQVVVSELVSSRYADGRRSESWDRRSAGIDLVRVESGETLKLRSSGGQSPPQRGWQLVLTDGDAAEGYYWTLYGLPKIAV